MKLLLDMLEIVMKFSSFYSNLIKKKNIEQEKVKKYSPSWKDSWS